ncbi:hypothetical protein JYU34_020593 [Plutella xylostella]|uniref:Uncharacterized protein n=1 Tax=Plutella xylostella TaxID=51655 RepID=A0ABQ7PUR6_PLUXY|nr:hypothetical protein JYU34_020593 [Plutella xylostella]
MDMDLIDLVDLEDVDILEDQREPRRGGENRLRLNPFLLDDEQFRYKYRFTKRFGQKIVDLLRDQLVQDPRGCPLSPELQVVCALRNWARHEVRKVYKKVIST